MIVITDTNIFYSALAAPQGEIAKILKDRKKIHLNSSNKSNFLIRVCF